MSQRHHRRGHLNGAACLCRALTGDAVTTPQPSVLMIELFATGSKQPEAKKALSMVLQRGRREISLKSRVARPALLRLVPTWKLGEVPRSGEAEEVIEKKARCTGTRRIQIGLLIRTKSHEG